MKDFKKWIRGLIGAFIQGFTVVISTMIVDPDTFNIGDGLGNVLTVAVVSGAVAAALFLHKKPLPGWLGGG